MTFTVNGDKILLRTYRIVLKKSGTRIPKVELVDMGPFINFNLERVHFASDDKRKPAMRIIKEKKQKNVTRNILGDKTARVHMKKQDLGSLQLRKVRALSKNAPIPVASVEGEEEK
jgi:ribosome production factor 2